MPFFCVYCCYREMCGGGIIVAQDEDDRMARQFEEEAAREVNYTLIQEEKTADIV